MAPQKYLARNHRFSITEDDNPDTATWTVISGINAFSWSEDSADADSSDFENAGWTSSFVVTRGATLSIEGQYLIDEATGAKDAGQLIAETAAHDFGPSGFRWVRMQALNTARSQVIGHIIVESSIKMGETGGGMEDINPFNIECMVQGKPRGSGIYAIFDLA